MPNDSTEHRKLAAIMFTDMVGYSALAQRDEALALALLEEHRRLLRSIFPKHQGQEIKTTGDGFLIEFASALAAVQSAVEIQRALAERNKTQPSERQVLIRIGIHVGDLVRKEGDVFGDGVNIAARIEPLAEPGGICLTQQVYDQVHNKLETGLVRLGHGELKNIPIPINIYRVVLPWGNRPLPFVSRLSFLFRQRRTRSFALAGFAFVLLAAVVWRAFHQHFVSRPALNQAIRIESLAVLPLKNYSGDPSKDWFADAMTEELIGALSKITSLKRVPSRTSIMRYKNTTAPMSEIAKGLDVDALVEGSVLLADDEVRITVQLIEGTTDRHLWANSYTNRATRIISLQGEVALAIAREIGLKLTPQDQLKIVKKPTENLEAYKWYLQGRIIWDARKADKLIRAIEYFNRAIEQDPKFALAYTGLADSYSSLGLSAFVDRPQRPEETMPPSKAAALKALELDDALSEAHTALTFATFYHDWDWRRSESEFKSALATDTNSAHAHHWYSHFLIARGKTNESLFHSQRALALEPRSILMNVHLGWHYVASGESDKAIEQLRNTLLLDGDFYMTHRYLGLAYEQQGRYLEAVQQLEESLKLSGGSTEIEAELGHTYALAGRREEARKILNELRDRRQNGFISAYSLALVSVGLDDKSQAFDWLERALAERSDRLVNLKVERVFDSLRSEARFIQLVQKVGLER